MSQVRLFLLTQLSIFLLSITIFSAHAKICDFSKLRPHEGRELELVPERISPFVREGERVFHLGTGDFDGSSVYRLIARDGSERVLKVYRNSRSLYFDLERFEAIEEVLQRIPEEERRNHFRVPATRNVLSSNVLEIDSIRGRAISSIRRVDRRDPLPAQVLRQYRERWDALIQSFRQRRLLVEGTEDRERMVAEVINPVTQLRVMIDLHAGNVVVDPQTAAMTIIDPF